MVTSPQICQQSYNPQGTSLLPDLQRDLAGLNSTVEIGGGAGGWNKSSIETGDGAGAWRKSGVGIFVELADILSPGGGLC